MDASLVPFFRPRGVVLVGASGDPAKLGFGVAHNLATCGYTGAVHFVNPRGGWLLDRPIYPDIASVPDPADLAVVLIPAPALPDALRACGARGIHAAIVLSGGFREVGAEGAALERECAEVAQALGIRVLGPNCIGVIDTHLPLDATFLPPPGPGRGDVAFISHSGAICAAVTDWASGQGFGLSHLISLGNQADVTETDMLAPVADDPHTRVLTLYLEGVDHGRRFVDEARRITRHKPVIALKVGRSDAGQRAVASHTGALAGRDAAYGAALRKAGVIRADTSEEMFDWARALAWCPLPAGRRVAVLTNAGGPGVIAADSLEACGLQLAGLDERTRALLRPLVPSAASLRNPVDILASASPTLYATCLGILLDDAGVDSILLILPPPPRDPAEAVVEAIAPMVARAAKPVVVALMGENAVRAAAGRLRALRIPDYRFPERAASALAVLAQRTEALARPASNPVTFHDVNLAAVRRIVDRRAAERGPAPASEGTAWDLPAGEAAEVLSAYGVAAPAVELAQTADEAALIAGRLGFPVALKVASRDIAHKSDVDGVLLGLPDARGVAEGFVEVVRRARAARPKARLDGVHVQRMVPAGQDVVVGVVRDPQFGPLVMFGSGGVEVEGLRDVAFALGPLSADDAEDLLAATWAGRRLAGFRNLPPADRAVVKEMLLRVAQLTADIPEIAEVEINPLRVLRAGQGAVALDVRIRLARAALARRAGAEVLPRTA